MKSLLVLVIAVVALIATTASAQDCPDGLCPLRRQVPTLAERPVAVAAVERAQCTSQRIDATIDHVQESRPVRSVLVRIATLPRRMCRCR